MQAWHVCELPRVLHACTCVWTLIELGTELLSMKGTSNMQRMLASVRFGSAGELLFGTPPRKL
jgi:hypothetical protein